MTEIDALKYDLERKSQAFDKLHKKYINLLKQQGKLEKENEELKFQLQSTCDQRDEFYNGARENANRVGELTKENNELKKQIKNSIQKADNMNCDCNPCIVGECVKKVIE